MLKAIHKSGKKGMADDPLAVVLYTSFFGMLRVRREVAGCVRGLLKV
jgi:hypothetical protein